MAQHSLADVKKKEMSRKPSTKTASDAKNVEQKRAMKKLATKMAGGFDRNPSSGRREVVKVRGSKSRRAGLSPAASTLVLALIHRHGGLKCLFESGNVHHRNPMTEL